MDGRVVGKLGGRGIGGDGDCEIVDIDGEEEGTKDGALGNAIGHWAEGAPTPFVFAGHRSVGEVVSKPEAYGAGDFGLIEYLPNESLGPNGVEGLVDVESDKQVVSFLGPGFVGCLDDGEGLLFC